MWPNPLFRFITSVLFVFVSELHLGALNKYPGSWMDPDLKHEEDSERMMREYCGSRIQGLASRRSVDEFIKEQRHTGERKDGNARFKRMTSEDIRSQLYPDEGSGLVVDTTRGVRFNPDLNGDVRLKRMADEDIRSLLMNNEKIRKYLGSNLSPGREIGDNHHQRARSRITNEYIRSQLAADEPLCLTKKSMGSGIPSPDSLGSGILLRGSLGSLETQELRTSTDVDDHPELNRMTSEYIKSQSRRGDKLELDPTAQSRHLNMTRIDLDPKLDVDPRISRVAFRPGKPDIDPRVTRGDLHPQVDPERNLHSADLEPKLDIDPRFCRRAVGVAGFRLRGPNWPYYNSRLVSAAEQGSEEAEIYNVRYNIHLSVCLSVCLLLLFAVAERKTHWGIRNS